MPAPDVETEVGRGTVDDLPSQWVRHPHGNARVAAVVPAYRVRQQVLDVLARIGPEIETIYVIDDACPERSGELVRERCDDPRVQVIIRERNGGVGAAVKTGYRAALRAGQDVVVKIDGDGQMDPALASRFIRPIVDGLADYSKGNRFFNPSDASRMPLARLIGNAMLSFLTKFSSGYWQLFDPTNGYTAIHTAVLAHLPLDKMSDRYFFESDMLFRLGTFRAVVVDVPMEAVYGGETSSLRFRQILGPFLVGHIRATVKRIFYSYFLRGFSIASLELIIGSLLFLFGMVYGVMTWSGSVESGIVETSGEVMLAALPVLAGLQLLLSFLQFDIASTPTIPLGRALAEVLDGQRRPIEPDSQLAGPDPRS